MKSIFKVLGAAALVASLTPYSVKKDEEANETTYQALLWKLTARPNAEDENKRDYNLTFAFNPPVLKKGSDEAEMFADDLMEDSSQAAGPVPVETAVEAAVSPEVSAPVEAAPVEAEASPSETTEA